jgi:hypothetical protein
MSSYVSNRAGVVCLWATYRLGNRSPRNDTDERKFGPKRIQELLLYLTCRADGYEPHGQRIGTAAFSKRAEKTTQPAISITRKASSPCSPPQGLNPSHRKKLLSPG